MIQLFICLGLMSVPLSLFGWETFGRGDQIRKLNYYGKFDDDLINLLDFHGVEWNSELIILYYIKLRFMRCFQIVLAFVFLAYIVFSYQAVAYSMAVGKPILQLFVQKVETLPNTFSWFFLVLGIAWVVSVFIRITASGIKADLVRISGREQTVLNRKQTVLNGGVRPHNAHDTYASVLDNFTWP